MPCVFSDKSNASCVIILGFLNQGFGVYLFDTGVGRTGYGASSKISVPLNNDGSFCTFGLPIVVLV